MIDVTKMIGGICLGSMLFVPSALADIVKAKADHYTLKHEATSDMAPAVLWARLIQPEIWWHPEHSYSGVSANLSLDATAGGLWREDWAGGSVAHGEVLSVQTGKQLRLNAPFGPLQGLGVNVVWTITITPEGDGSKVTFDEIANGTSESGLDALAPAVDFVKGEAIKRLATSSLE
ncbi:SRPBCC family protein [Kordiimonas aquimaris]|uniref:SRPBCC family protein n=1 Tax=Kordiimonas aquimaris TaxID=707591 RepID=UPI0021CE2361|nr:hypothetical protein [Kordiimonas aquimaris]